jgi:hypothetical protein
MPKLHAVVENLDDVSDSLREYYTEAKDKDGKVWFTLALDDDVRTHPSVVALQRAHERQKEINNELKTKNAELEKRVENLPDEFDPEEFNRLKELEKQLEASGGEPDPEKKKQHEAEIQSVKKMHEQQLARIQKKMEDGFAERDAKNNQLQGRVQNMVVNDGLTRLLLENGVKKDALPFVLAKLEKSIKVQEEDGEYVAMVNTDLGETPLDQFIPKWTQSDEAKMFVEQPKGGDAPGGKGKGIGAGDSNPWSAGYWDMGRQGEIVKRDMARADRMAKAAGHKKALGALLMDAK